MQKILMAMVMLVVCANFFCAAKEEAFAKPSPCRGLEIVDVNGHTPESDDFFMISPDASQEHKAERQALHDLHAVDISMMFADDQLKEQEDAASVESQVQVEGEQNLFSCTLLRILEEGLDQLPQSIADAEVRTLQQGRRIILSFGQKYIIEMTMHIKPSEG